MVHSMLQLLCATAKKGTITEAVCDSVLLLPGVNPHYLFLVATACSIYIAGYYRALPNVLPCSSVCTNKLHAGFMNIY